VVGNHSQRRRQNSLAPWPFAYRGSSSWLLGTPRLRGRSTSVVSERASRGLMGRVLLSTKVLLDTEVSMKRPTLHRAPLGRQLHTRIPEVHRPMSVSGQADTFGPSASSSFMCKASSRRLWPSKWCSQVGVHYASDQDGEGKPRSDTRHTRHSARLRRHLRVSSKRLEAQTQKGLRVIR
jgi:hypothetical protein